MRRRWKRRLLWTALLLTAALLAIPATVSQGAAALGSLGRDGMRRLAGAA